ncbi:MAG: hypothetical protein ACQEVA_14570 [Myxococcota bacterium]
MQIQFSGVPSVLLIVSGLFLLVGMVTGVWKYRQMMTRPDRQAHIYVDTAHRASLMYSFATLVLAALAAASVWPDWVDAIAAGANVLFFASAVARYIQLGITEQTRNQFEREDFFSTIGMYLLIVGEVGGVLVLLLGAAMNFLG